MPQFGDPDHLTPEEISDKTWAGHRKRQLEEAGIDVEAWDKQRAAEAEQEAGR